KSCFEIAKFHRAKQASDVSAKRPQGRAAVRCGLDGKDEEDRRARQRCGHRLCHDARAIRWLRHDHRIGLPDGFGETSNLTSAPDEVHFQDMVVDSWTRKSD